MLRNTHLHEKPSKSELSVTVYNKNTLPTEIYKGITKRSKIISKMDIEDIEFQCFPYDIWCIIIDYVPIHAIIRLE